MDSKHRRFQRQATERPVIDGMTTTVRPSARAQLLKPTATTLNSSGAAAITGTYEATRPPIQKKRFTPPATKASRWEKLQLPLIISGATIVGLFLKTEAVGIIAIAIYSLFALIFRIPSRTTFALAAMSIAAVSCLLLFKPDLELAGNFTTYTFLLLVTGVITLIIEGRPLNRRKRGRPGRAR